MDNFGAFYQVQRTKLFYYLMRMTGDYYLSGDIMQESFTRLLKHYGTDAQNAVLLFTIARNALRDHARKNNRNTELEGEDRDPSDDSEQQLMVRQEYRRVLAAMQQLEVTERELLALAADSGYWELTMTLPEGEHHFSYILEGRQRVADPTIRTREPDDFGGYNSILRVGDKA